MERRENKDNQSHPLLTSSSSPDQEHAEPTNIENEESISRSDQDYAEEVVSEGNGDLNIEDGVGQSATAIPEVDVAVGLPRCFVPGESSAPIPRNVAEIDPSSLVFHPGLATKSGKKTRKNKKVQGIRIGMKEGQPSNPFLDLNRFPSCYICKKEFFSWKAVHGHMRTHPERQWRGTVPPPSVAPPSIPVAADDIRELPVPATNQDVEVATGLLLLSFGNSRGVLRSSANNVQEQEPPPRSEHVNANSASSSNTRHECSVCKKVFPTHQGLGGHRASHKSVRGCHAMDNTAAEHHSAERNGGNEMDTGNIFGCRICLRRFASGQALGGHMRRHAERREEASSSAQDSNVDPTSLRRIGLVVDLNLPLPPNIPPPPYLPAQNDEDSSAASSSSSSPSPETSLDLHL